MNILYLKKPTLNQFQNVSCVAFCILCLTIIMTTVLCHVEENCQEPTLQSLSEALNTARNTNRQQLILIGQGSASRNLVSNCTLRTPIDWDTRCPANLQALDNSPNSPIKDRSVCPYYFEIETDSHRFPKAITRAVCKCQYCLEDHGPSSKNVCEPVHTPEMVLRRGRCTDGVYQYHPTEIQRQISCLCARMREIIVSSSTTESAAAGDALGPVPVA